MPQKHSNPLKKDGIRFKLKCAVSWSFAILLAFLCVDILSFFYYSNSGILTRTGAATDWIYMPGSVVRFATEGYGITRIDKNGYANGNEPLANNYVLLMGSSYLEGLHVMDAMKVSSILSCLLADDGYLHSYNIARSGNYFPSIVRGFSAAMSEFPDAFAVVIEIDRTDFDVDEIISGCEQAVFHEASTGSALAGNMNTRQKAISVLKRFLPYLDLLKAKQFANMDFGLEGAFGLGTSIREPSYDLKTYAAALQQALGLIRSECDTPILILYHPAVTMNKDGEMEIVRDEDTYHLFQQSCKDHQIMFIDTGNAFLDAYREDYTVPYGFSNTAKGTGHLNAAGHAIVAEVLYNNLISFYTEAHE